MCDAYFVYYLPDTPGGYRYCTDDQNIFAPNGGPKVALAFPWMSLFIFKNKKTKDLRKD